MEWYYAQDGARVGPVSEAELVGLLASGRVPPGALVWKEGLPGWTPARDLAALWAGHPSGPPPPPLPSSAAPSLPGAGQPRPVIPNYLWQSIVVTLLCCLPFGIPAIVYAAKVDGLVARGDWEAARRASGSAKTWCLVSFILGLLSLAIWLGMVVVGVAAESSR